MCFLYIGEDNTGENPLTHNGVKNQIGGEGWSVSEDVVEAL